MMLTDIVSLNSYSKRCKTLLTKSKSIRNIIKALCFYSKMCFYFNFMLGRSICP